MKRIIFHEIVFAVLCLWMHDVSNCQTDICLTWTVSNKKLELKCKVQSLRYTVHFENPLDKEQGVCLHPFPKPICKSYYNNVKLIQDVSNNLTILTIIGHIDNKLNGMWKCTHGTDRDQAIANVTVLTQGLDSDCVSDFVLFTMSGFLVCLFFGYTVQAIYSFGKCKGLFNCLGTTFSILHERKQRTKDKIRILAIYFVRIFFIAFSICTPIVIGLYTDECRPLGILFSLLGFTIQGFLLLSSLPELHKENLKGKYADDPSNQEGICNEECANMNDNINGDDRAYDHDEVVVENQSESKPFQTKSCSLDRRIEEKQENTTSNSLEGLNKEQSKMTKITKDASQSTEPLL